MPDVFISHATEDKDAIARPLADALRARGFEVWYDEYSLRLGDGLRETIDRGLAQSRFGVVILSPNFFTKPWPRRELDGLVARETGEGSKRILPIWHGVDATQVREFSPTLADRLAIHTDQGLASVVESIVRELREGPADTRTSQPRVTHTQYVNVPPEYQRRLNAIRFDIASRRDPGTGRPIPPEHPLTEKERTDFNNGLAVIVPEFLPARPFGNGFIIPRLRVWNLGRGPANNFRVLVNGSPFTSEHVLFQHGHTIPADLQPNDCAEVAFKPALLEKTIEVEVHWLARDGNAAAVRAIFEVTPSNGR